VSAATYRLVVEGELDNRFAYLFGDMEMTHADGRTVLTGPVVDQAQLHGFIERIEELGLKLVSLQEERSGGDNEKGDTDEQ
jgi:hypothetical protein